MIIIDYQPVQVASIASMDRRTLVSWKELGRAIAALRDRQVNGKVVLTIN